MNANKKSFLGVLILSFVLSIAMSVLAFAGNVNEKYDMDLICKRIVNAYENQTGNYKANSKFTVDVSDLNIAASDVGDIIYEFEDRYPLISLMVQGGYSYSQNYVAYLVYYNKYDWTTSTTMRKEMGKTIAEVLSGVDPEMSDYEKVLYLYDYLAVNTQYDFTYENHDIYNVLVDRTAVCQGYAETFQFLAKIIGLKETYYVSSSALNHAWNIVNIDGSYYNVDTTWGDPVPDLPGRAHHTYFLKSTQWFTTEGGHNSNDWVIRGANFSMNHCSSTRFDKVEFPQETKSPLVYRNGKWYAVYDTGSKGELAEFTCKNCQFVKQRTLASFDRKWYIPPENKSYYSGVYSGMCRVGDKLYYNTDTKVMKYDLTTGASSTVYTLTSEQQKQYRIYGLALNRSKGCLDLDLMPNMNHTQSGKTWYYDNLKIFQVSVSTTSSEADYLDKWCPSTQFNKVVNTVSGVHLYWNAAAKKPDYYLIYRNTSEYGSYSNVGRTTATNFTDQSVTSGTTYFYRVIAVYDYVNSHFSDALSYTYVGTPDITGRVNSVNGIKLTWNKIAGAKGYAVYRKGDGANDSWKRVKTAEGAANLSWIDSAVKGETYNGTVFHYTVRALTGSDLSILSGCRSTGRTMVRLSSPSVNSLTKVSATSFKATWSRNRQATGYEVRLMVGGEVYKSYTFGGEATVVKTLSGLPKGKTYSVQVRSYYKTESAGTYYSGWSEKKNIKL